MYCVLVWQARNELLHLYSRLTPMSREKQFRICGSLSAMVIVIGTIIVALLGKLIESKWSKHTEEDRQQYLFWLVLYSSCIIFLIMCLIWVAIEARAIRHRRAVHRQALLLMSPNVLENTNNNNIRSVDSQFISV